MPVHLCRYVFKVRQTMLCINHAYSVGGLNSMQRYKKYFHIYVGQLFEPQYALTQTRRSTGYSGNNMWLCVVTKYLVLKFNFRQTPIDKLHFIITLQSAKLECYALACGRRYA